MKNAPDHSTSMHETPVQLTESGRARREAMIGDLQRTMVHVHGRRQMKRRVAAVTCIGAIVAGALWFTQPTAPVVPSDAPEVIAQNNDPVEALEAPHSLDIQTIAHKSERTFVVPAMSQSARRLDISVIGERSTPSRIAIVSDEPSRVRIARVDSDAALATAFADIHHPMPVIRVGNELRLPELEVAMEEMNSASEMDRRQG